MSKEEIERRTRNCEGFVVEYHPMGKCFKYLLELLVETKVFFFQNRSAVRGVKNGRYSDSVYIS